MARITLDHQQLLQNFTDSIVGSVAPSLNGYFATQAAHAFVNLDRPDESGQVST
jgi:hypothetical protein